MRKCCNNRKIEPFCVTLAHFWTSKNFPKNVAPSWQSWVKCCRKNNCQTNNWGILAHFQCSENFLKRFGSFSFTYLWSHNFIQKIRKNYCANPKKKSYSNGWTKKSDHSGSFLPVFRQAIIFLKNLAPSVLSLSTSCKIWNKSNEPDLRSHDMISCDWCVMLILSGYENLLYII